MGQGSGDKLARGASRANFQTTNGKVTQSAWDKAFNDFNPEEFENAPNKSRIRLRTNSDKTGDVSPVLGRFGVIRPKR